MNKLICTILILVMVLSFAGCQSDHPGAGSTPTDSTPVHSPSAPTQANGIVLNEVLYWDMQIVRVDANGNALESGETTARVVFSPCSDYQYNCSFNFKYQETSHTFSGAVRMNPKNPDSDKFSYDIPFGAQYVWDDPVGKAFSFGLDPNRQCFILDVDDGKDEYLIGYTDANAELADLWAYFQGFIENRPAEFPKKA